MADFIFTEPKQTKAERARRDFVADRLFQMDTDYRQSILDVAELGRLATDGIVTEGEFVGPNELMKIPISHAVIMQRMSTMIDNPSKAIYRGEVKNKNQLEVVRQLNIHDKRVGKYDAVYQDAQYKAERQAITIMKQGWHEEFREIGGKQVTVGDFFTEQNPVLLENFFWDPTANELRGDVGLVANDTMEREFWSEADFKREFENNKEYKNISKVKPWAADEQFNVTSWSPEWAAKTIKSDNPVNEVILWRYNCRNFWDAEQGRWRDVELGYANGVEVLIRDINLPKKKGKAQLPYFKIVALPTGGFAGLSIPAIIQYPELALQRMITMADAQAELAVNPVLFMSNNLMDALEDEELYPGTRIGTAMQGRQMQDEIYEMNVRDITNGATYIIDKMLELITLITGVDIRAFSESPKQKAVSTERKREIQEKLLRASVIYNESHGFTDMEEMRLLIMLENWPVKRHMYLMKNGVETSEERYPQIPIDGFQVRIVGGDEAKPTGEQQFEVKKAANSFSFLTIAPGSIIDAYNVDLFIEGATLASNEDVFKLNKAMDKIGIITTNPYAAGITDPVKAGKQVYKALNVDVNEWIKEELESSDDTKYGAEKEIQALIISDVFPDIALPIDADYDAKKYEEVFSQFIILPEFKKLTPTVQSKLIERQAFHTQNALNPYYKETMRAAAAAKEAESQAMTEEPEAGGTTAQSNSALQGAKVQPKPGNELSQVVDSKAGKLGKAGKGKTTNSNEQK